MTHLILSRPMARRLRGFSMIEVLVAVLVMSVGLLGMAALMTTSLRNGQSANQRTQATNLAYDVIDMMRADRRRDSFARINAALGSYSDPEAICGATTKTPLDYSACTGAASADRAYLCDIDRWQRDLCYTLPNGRGRINIDPVPGSLYAFRARVDICWSDDRTGTGAIATCPQPTPACTLANPSVAACDAATGACTFSMCAGL